MKRSTAMVTALAAAVLAISTPTPGGAAAGQPASGRPPACERATGEPPPPGSTTLSTLEQAYHCVIENYVAGDTLNNRTLLAAAFTGFTSELDRRRLDLSAATMPALTGDRDGDWAAFSEVYRRVLDQLPDDADLRQALAAASIEAMVAGLHDNHARWHQPGERGGRPGETFGLALSPPEPPDLYVTTVDEGGPADERGVRPGDIIRSVNDFPPFINGQFAPGVTGWLTTSSGEPVELVLERPSTGETLTVTVAPEPPGPGPEPNVTAARVAGDLAHITFRGFDRGVADEIMLAIAELRGEGPLNGVILDVRRNSGGSVAEVGRLLGAFVHGRPYGFTCDENYDNCKPKRTDDTVELLGLPLALLTSRGCPSACDAFSAAVRDLELGPIIGTRTAGVVSGESVGYLLDDGSDLLLPRSRGLGPDHEMINEIGVAPDYYLPLTAADLSAERDPALDKAIAILRG